MGTGRGTPGNPCHALITMLNIVPSRLTLSEPDPALDFHTYYHSKLNALPTDSEGNFNSWHHAQPIAVLGMPSSAD